MMTMIISSKHCVVPENIHTLPMEGIGISRGGGGSMAQENPGGGVVSIYIIFSRPVPLFLYVKFSLFAFYLPICRRKRWSC